MKGDLVEHMDDGQFKKELNNLRQMILKMGSLVVTAIHESFKVLERRDIQKAKTIIESDREIDVMELKLDEQCLRMLALYQPVASDLRFVTTAMSIATDLERIGDLALNIAQRVVEMGEEPLLKPLIDLPKMVAIVKEMLNRSLDAFIRRDTAMAKTITKMQHKTDVLKELIYKEVQEIMTRNPQSVKRGLPLILITHHLERIVGHTINIVEDVVYMVDAQVIKHKDIEKHN